MLSCFGAHLCFRAGSMAAAGVLVRGRSRGYGPVQPIALHDNLEERCLQHRVRNYTR
jgi:hypothetical protein